MAQIVEGVDWKSAPKDYSALFQTYYDYIVNLVRKNGIDDSHKEDIASDIIARLIENDVIGQFDPDYSCSYKGENREAKFRSFLAHKVTLYTHGYRDKLKRTRRREVLICDLQVGDGTADGHGFRTDKHEAETWVEFQPDQREHRVDDVIELVAEEQDAHFVRRWLGEQPRRSRSDALDLVAIYDAVRGQLREFGEYDVEKLKVQFDISTTTMHSWLWHLKAYLAEYYGRPCPPRRAHTTRPKVQP